MPLMALTLMDAVQLCCCVEIVIAYLIKPLSKQTSDLTFIVLLIRYIQERNIVSFLALW